MQNQSFLDALSAKLTIAGGNSQVQRQPATMKLQECPFNNTTAKWKSSHTSSIQATQAIQRSPSFGSSKMDNGTKTFNTVTNYNAAANVHSNVNAIPNSNKNSIHTEIEQGAFNLRKTNGILYDRSAPKL